MSSPYKPILEDSPMQAWLELHIRRNAGSTQEKVVFADEDRRRKFKAMLDRHKVKYTCPHGAWAITCLLSES